MALDPTSPVSFTAAAAAKLVDAARRVLNQPTSTPNARNPLVEPNTTFWAYLSSPGGINGLFWSWVRVVPVPQLQQPTVNNPVTIDDVPLFQFSSPPIAGYQNAREVNGHREVPAGSVVKMEFIGYAADKSPLYVFAYNMQPADTFLPVHNHSDNFSGGYAWAVYHPGTSTPQQQWHI
jgi:hypothetical protein